MLKKKNQFGFYLTNLTKQNVSQREGAGDVKGGMQGGSV